MEVAERDGSEALDKMVEDDLGYSSAIRQPGYEDGVVQLGRLVQVKLYSLSHLDQWGGYLIVEYEREGGLIGIRVSIPQFDSERFLLFFRNAYMKWYGCTPPCLFR